jgi:hypothetical protein
LIEAVRPIIGEEGRETIGVMEREGTLGWQRKCSRANKFVFLVMPLGGQPLPSLGLTDLDAVSKGVAKKRFCFGREAKA